MFFKQSSLVVRYHSISTLCLLCNLLDPHAKNPNYTFEVRACAVNFFLLDLFVFFKSFFLSLGIYSALFLAGRGFRKIPEVQEVHFKVFQWLVKQEFHWNIFKLKLHYLLPIFSFMFHWTVLILVWFQRSCPPAQVKLNELVVA